MSEDDEKNDPEEKKWERPSSDSSTVEVSSEHKPHLAEKISTKEKAALPEKISSSEETAKDADDAPNAKKASDEKEPAPLAPRNEDATADEDESKDDTSLPEGMEKLSFGEREESTNPGLKVRDPLRLAPTWRRWIFAVVPLLGLTELGLHEYQTHDVVPEDDFRAAKDEIKKEITPNDLVLFAPKWVDPIGRETFGDVMTFARAARPDESRFARAFEVSIRGSHRAEVSTWKRVGEKHVGAVTIYTLENPSPVTLKDDIVQRLRPESASVSRVDSAGNEQPCMWTQGATISGGVYYPFGPATPGAKFTCNGTFAGVSVIQDLEHDPRLCILAPPPGQGALRIRFANIAFGNSLRGHHGLHYDTERRGGGDVISLVFKSGDKNIGRAEHRVGSGWSGFELSTQELSGQRGELTVDVIGRGGEKQYCFEADTR